MGSGDWLKTIISRKKGKYGNAKKSKETSSSAGIPKEEKSFGVTGDSANLDGSGTNEATSIPKEEKAAIRIQTAFRAYKARKVMRRMKGIVRLQRLTQGDSIEKQSTSVLTYLHAWSRIQAQIKERRLCMVAEGRIRQKKLENQIKREAKLHDSEVEWCSGSDTMEEALARIHQREEAAVKRERALAYAFSHQWRANSNQSQGANASELGKANWGWSWKERWIAARPWESRVSSQSISPTNSKKAQNKSLSRTSSKSTTPSSSQKSLPAKSASMNGKGPPRARRLSFPAGKAPAGEANKGRETNIRKEVAT